MRLFGLRLSTETKNCHSPTLLENCIMNPALSIPVFYAGRSIFVTGGTGFMGKVLIEKLLRSCPDIREIFVLMRSKRELNIQDRLKEMLSLPLFDKIREEKPSSFTKLIPVNGDIYTEGLGLSPDDREMLVEKVSIIIHGAAIVKFNAPLRSIIFANIRATRDICILAEEMRNLIALTFLSTAYCQADKVTIDEKLYPINSDWRHVITIAESAIDDETLNILTVKYLGNFVNCYVFSKRIAEQVIQDFSKTLPCVIVRPTIVTPAYKEPISGWVDVINGPITFYLVIAKGIIKTLILRNEKRANYVPVDTSINLILTTTWKCGLTSLTENPELKIYNCAVEDINLMPQKLMMKEITKCYMEMPATDVIWRPSLYGVSNVLLYYMLNIFLHFLPAVCIDSILRLRKRPPILLELQRKVFISNIMLMHFAVNEWHFLINNIKSLATEVPLDNIRTFDFSYLFQQANILEYYRNCIIGCKKFILNEPINEEAGKKHFKRICLISEITEKSILFGIIWLLYKYRIFHGILNILLYVVNQLIIGKLFATS